MKDKTYLLGLLPLIITLLFGALPALLHGSNPRLFIHQHTPYSDITRVRRELDLAVELGFGGIRTEWGALQMLNADNSFGGTWSQRDVIEPLLQELKKRSLGLHVTFGNKKPGATLEQEAVFYRFVMQRTVEVLGAKNVSWSVANEPAAWVTRGDDGYIRARWLACIQIRDELGQGTLYSPTLPGWETWNWSQPVLATEEAHRRLLRLEWLYDPNGLQRSLARRTGLASSFYAPVYDHDATTFTREVAGAMVRAVRRDYSATAPIFWTEANVRNEQGGSEHWKGLKQAQIVKALLSLDPNSKACAYVLSGHSGMDFMSATGARNTDRIRGFVEGMR